MATNNYSYDPKDSWKYKPPKGIDDMRFLLLAFWGWFSRYYNYNDIGDDNYGANEI